ncbi:MAG: hypothetical protein OXM55_02375 [Bdellovibrionales bacterium]|nr:hypothetical protein [Bdellovibrionales bacterium]
MEKQYENFYQEYRNKLNKKYPSIAKTDLPIPPISPFVINLSQETINDIKDLVKTFYKVVHLKNYAQQIQTDKNFYLNAPASNSSLLMSYDFHLDQDNNLKLIEVNTHSSGYLVSDLVDQVNGLTSQSEFALSSLKKSFEQEWESFSEQPPPPANTLIADHKIKDQKMYIEFLMYKDLLSSWGWPCQLYEIENLSINPQGMLVDAQQKTVHMLYNRCTDFYFENWPLLKEAFLNQTCCISPHPREYLLLADKARLCEWSNPKGFNYVHSQNKSPQEEIKIQNAVPFTALVSSISANELWEKRKKLFFKPLRGYGGKSVYRGKSISRNMFDRIIKEPGIFQEIVPPPTFLDPSGTKWKYDIRAYAYKDQVQKLSARVYQGQLTQFQTPLSGFASICTP